MRPFITALNARRENVIIQAVTAYQKGVLTPEESLCYIARLSELKLVLEEIERTLHERPGLS